MIVDAMESPVSNKGQDESGFLIQDGKKPEIVKSDGQLSPGIYYPPRSPSKRSGSSRFVPSI